MAENFNWRNSVYWVMFSFHVDDEKIPVFDFSGPASLALYFPGAVVGGGGANLRANHPQCLHGPQS